MFIFKLNGLMGLLNVYLISFFFFFFFFFQVSSIKSHLKQATLIDANECKE
jgi:hypothetical protein